MNKLTVRDIPVGGKRVLVRVDYNVPLDKGIITDDARIRGSLPTIRYLLEREAQVILISHLGRPKGMIKEDLRLDPVAKHLSGLLDKRVGKINTVVGEEAEEAASKLKDGEILLLENVRFEGGEEKNDPQLAKKMAKLADVYVNDAFGTAHRAHASTEGVTRFLTSVAGLLMEKEIEALQRCLYNPERPFTAVFGGAKISDKIGVIHKFLDMADYLLIGGGMANTFHAAKGHNMAASLIERTKLDVARELLSIINKKKKHFYLSDDVIVVQELEEGAPFRTVTPDSVPSGWQSVDIGPVTIESFSEIIKKSRMVVWNGPLGVFEMSPFHRGTEGVARAAINSDAYVLVGGGDTAAAFEKFGIVDEADYVSTGGGATLEFLEGKDLPGIAALKERI